MAILAKEKILTLDYWKPASQIEVGDYLFDRNGKVVRVKSMQTYMATRCFTVHLSDCISISGDGKMRLLLENKKYRDRTYTYKGKQKFKRPLMATPLEDILDKPLKNKYGHSAFSIPTCGSLKFPHQDLPIPPFVMGYWFRNKTKSGINTIKHKYYKFLEEKLRGHGYSLTTYRSDRADSEYFWLSPKIETQLAPFIPTQIPNNYLLASEEQRVELLSGLIMGKVRQFNKSKNSFKISMRTWNDMHRIQGLVESLGCRTHMEYSESIGYYTLSFKTWHNIHPDQQPLKNKVHQSRRYVRQIEEIQPQLCVHIETDGEDGSFLAGEGFITCR